MPQEPDNSIENLIDAIENIILGGVCIVIAGVMLFHAARILLI